MRVHKKITHHIKIEIPSIEIEHNDEDKEEEERLNNIYFIVTLNYNRMRVQIHTMLVNTCILQTLTTTT